MVKIKLNRTDSFQRLSYLFNNASWWKVSFFNEINNSSIAVPIDGDKPATGDIDDDDDDVPGTFR